MPQTHPPAAEAEVDFDDLWVVLRGVKTKTALFTMRLSYSGRAAHRAFAIAGAGGVPGRPRLRLHRLGGVPIDKIRYDNLKTAVSRVLFGRDRVRRPSGGSRSARTTASTRSTASPVMRAATRRAGWRARVAGSAATTASRCRWWTRSTSSTRCWPLGRRRRPPADRQPRHQGRAGLGHREGRCCGRCRPSRSRPR